MQRAEGWTEKQRHASIHAVMISEDKQCTDTSGFAYCSSTMESEKMSFTVSPLVNEEENYLIPGNVQHSGQSVLRGAAAVPLWIPRKPPPAATICTHTVMHEFPSLYESLCSSTALQMQRLWREHSPPRTLLLWAAGWLVCHWHWHTARREHTFFSTAQREPILKAPALGGLDCRHWGS